LDRPTSGEYFLDHADVSVLNRDQLADIRNRKIGFVFQNFNLLRAHPRGRMPSCRSSTAHSIYRTHRFANEQITCSHRSGLPGVRTITQVSFPAASNSASP